MKKLIKRTIISIIITVLSSKIAKRLKVIILNYHPNLKDYVTQEKGYNQPERRIRIK